MSKKSKAKAKKKNKYDDTPVYAPPSEKARSFPCPRCQAEIGSAANLPDHQLNTHL